MSAPARAQEDPRHAADEELGHEGERPQHRRREADRSAVERRDDHEQQLGDRHGDEQRRDREDVRHARVDARDELVVRPDEEAQHARRDGRVEHDLVAEELLAGEGRDDVDHDADGRQQHHVDLGVPEEPEEVLPEDRVTAPRRVVEARADRLVEEEHHRAGDERPHREHEEDAGDDDHPDDHGDVVGLHPGRAGVHQRRDEVDAPQQEGDELQRHGQKP